MQNIMARWILRASGYPPKEPGEPGELHRLPDRESGEDLHADTEDHCSVKETLHRIVMAETMREPETQRIAKVA